jgi:anti-anti-sigma regulatory factor
MRSEALDITIESRSGSVLLVLSGPFHGEQISNIREKITGLIDDGNKVIVVDLNGISEIIDVVVTMFLNLLNLMKEKHCELQLIFRNSTVKAAFAQYRNLFSIYPDAQSLAFKSLISRIRRRGVLLSRKTGIRLSPPVAIFIFIVLAGWLSTLVLIISMQNARISDQEKDITELTELNKRSSHEISRMKERLKPIEQLGLIRDSIAPIMTNTTSAKQNFAPAPAAEESEPADSADLPDISAPVSEVHEKAAHKDTAENPE